MSTTSLIGGGLIAGESLYTLGAGIVSLLGRAMSAAWHLRGDHNDSKRIGRTMILLSSTHPRWFAASSADLPALLSDHLHCERKAAENALSLVRRYPHRGTSVDKLARLAHEETSHVVQVARCWRGAGGRRAPTRPTTTRGRCSPRCAGASPERLLDALLVAAFIEARSHERLGLLARGLRRAGRRRAGRLLRGARRAPRSATPRSSSSWRGRCCPPPTARRAFAELAQREAEILAALPHVAAGFTETLTFILSPLRGARSTVRAVRALR